MKMISKELTDKIKNLLIQNYNPLKIYIFGSYAWGMPNEESDLDLLLVVDNSDLKVYKRSIKAYQALRDIRISKDILVYTAQEFEERCKDRTTLSYKIMNEGKMIYDAV
jgi:uncharacterized protein